MVLDAGDGAEALLVLWTGGWAGLEAVINGLANDRGRPRDWHGSRRPDVPG